MHVTQDVINEHLVREAQAGFKVVRLKGGDPSVFGRLDEELAALSEYGIEFRSAGHHLCIGRCSVVKAVTDTT